MPGFHIHLAIAKRYAEKNSGKINDVKDLNLFYNGTIAPDLATLKSLTHYGHQPDSKEDLYLCTSTYVDLSRYLNANKIITDFDRGVFLHLITDYKFYMEFFKKEYLKTRHHGEFMADLYNSYDKTNSYIENKYDLASIDKYIDLKKIEQIIIQSKKIKRVADYIPSDYKPVVILDKTELDSFIEDISDTDLQQYQKIIKE